jgi:hypothetical protein
MKLAKRSTTSLMIELKMEMSDWVAETKVWKMEAKSW